MKIGFFDFLVITLAVFIGVAGALAIAGVFVKQQVQTTSAGGIIGAIAGLLE